MAQWFASLTRNVEVIATSLCKAPLVSLSKKLYPYCLVLVGSRNGFERDITIEVNYLRALWKIDLKCQISPLVKYRQNQTNVRALYCMTGWLTL